jgi:hypothetical protein
MKTAIAGMIIAVLLPVAAAHADSADDNYLALLSSHGIKGPPDQLIADGHQACDALQPGRLRDRHKPASDRHDQPQ